MGKFVVKDAVVKINNVDLSDRVASVTVMMEGDDVDVSTMGTGVHQHLIGLRNDRFEITFLSDFAASSVDATLFPLLSTASVTTEFPVEVSAFTGTTTTTNPKYSSQKCILNQYSPIAGTIGARSETAVTFLSNEAIARGTT